VQRIREATARQEAVHRLRSCLLALDHHPAWHVPQHDAGGDLVHVLTALAARTHEAFVEIGLANAESGEANRQGALLFRTHGKHFVSQKVTRGLRDFHGTVSRLGVAKRDAAGIRRPPMSMRTLVLLLGLGTLTLATPARSQPVAGFDDTVFQGGLSAP